MKLYTFYEKTVIALNIRDAAKYNKVHFVDQFSNKCSTIFVEKISKEPPDISWNVEYYDKDDELLFQYWVKEYEIYEGLVL